MVREVGDLWPGASGLASLGMELLPGGGQTDEIRPFAAVHMNSGVFHATNANSGIIRCGINSAGLSTIEFKTRFNPLTPDYPLVFTADPAGGSKVESITGDLDIESASSMALDVASAFSAVVGGLWSQTCSSYLNISEFDIDFVTTDGDVIFRPGIAIPGSEPGGQIDFRAFAASGRLEYRFGPHQSWYIKTSDSSTSGPFGDGFNPLVPSGQILQMILENGGGGGSTGLQASYDIDPTIVTDGTTPVTVIADDHVGAIFTPIGETAGIPISVSGFIQRPTTAVENVGDMMMFQHAFGSDGRPHTATSVDEAKALALGPGHLSVNTGSGIAPIPIASGITQFVNISAVIMPEDTTGQDIIWHTAGNQFPDKFYTVATGDDYVSIMVPGLYLASYKVTFEKREGLQRSTAVTELRLNDDTIIGGTSSAYLRNTTDNTNTANGVCMFNAAAGDEIKVRAAMLTNVSEEVRILSRECTLILQYISPPRGGISVA